MVHRQSGKCNWSTTNAKHNTRIKRSRIIFNDRRRRSVQSAASLTHVVCVPTTRAVNNGYLTQLLRDNLRSSHILPVSLCGFQGVLVALSFCINISYLLHTHTKYVSYIPQGLISSFAPSATGSSYLCTTHRDFRMLSEDCLYENGLGLCDRSFVLSANPLGFVFHCLYLRISDHFFVF